MSEDTTEVETANDTRPADRLTHEGGNKYTAKVRGKSVTFIIRKDRPAVVWDLLINQRHNHMMVGAAAIGLFWFGHGKPKAAGEVYTNAVQWGELVANELLSRGWSPGDLLDLGRELTNKAAETLPEIAEEEPFLG